MNPITQAILPVAGLGTRFLPWTKSVPKEMLPIGNQPIIAHIVHECLDAGIERFCFVISKGKESIPEYFFEDLALEEELAKRGKSHLLAELKRYDNVDFHTVYQDEQRGDGHAVLQARDWVLPAPAAILFGDDLFLGGKSGLAQLAAAHEEAGDDAVLIALETIAPEKSDQYGIAQIAAGVAQDEALLRIAKLVEKPKPADAPSNLGIVGRYVIPPSTFTVLPGVGSSHGGEIRLIDAFIAQLDDVPVYGIPCRGTRIDVGTPEGYAEALKHWSDR